MSTISPTINVASPSHKMIHGNCVPVTIWRKLCHQLSMGYLLSVPGPSSFTEMANSDIPAFWQAE